MIFNARVEKIWNVRSKDCKNYSIYDPELSLKKRSDLHNFNQHGEIQSFSNRFIWSTMATPINLRSI